MSPFAGMSNIPFMILAHGGQRSSHLVELHKKDPIVRIGPNSLSFGDASMIKDIYGHGAPNLKDESYEILAGSHFHLADVVDKAEHARKRKVLSAAYALKNLEGWEHKVADKTQKLIRHLDECCTLPMKEGQHYPDSQDLTVDYRKWTNFFTLDAIADIGLSDTLGLSVRGHDIIEVTWPDGSTSEVSVRDSLYSTIRKQSLLIWSYQHYKLVNKLADIIPFYRRLAVPAKGWDAIVHTLAERRLQRYRSGEKLDDFFQALMEDKNGVPNNLEWGEIVAEVNIMMNAGSTTTAIAMANVMYQLLKHPAIMARLREELDAVLDADEVIAPYDKVKHLPYLRAVLDESLRLFPPTPHGLARTTPAEGLWVTGTFIPGNTTVSMSALVVHRDEKVFREADKFIPERFLGEEGKALQSYFLSFSAGSRGCIGRNISYLEQTVALASVVHRYNIAMAPGFELQRLETLNWMLGELPIKVWRRELS